VTTWTFSDGTELETGGTVSGTGKVAAALREAIREKSGVHVFPPPDAPVPLVASNDFMLDVLAHEVGRRLRKGVFTDYVRDLDDAPPALQKRIREKRDALHRAPFGRVY